MKDRARRSSESAEQRPSRLDKEMKGIEKEENENQSLRMLSPMKEIEKKEADLKVTGKK